MYCYPDTDILINKLDIRDKTELKQAEEEFTAVKQMALLQEPIKGRFTKTHLFRIHRFLFEDVYPFAGHIRKEQISKGDTMFYPPDLIDRELERVFKNIHSKKLLAEQDEEKQIQNLSQTMAELNIIHPFREGNGRSTRELIRCMALEYSLHINWGNTDRETLIDSAIAAVDDDMAFCDVLKPVSYTHLRAHETRHDLVCRLLLEKKKRSELWTALSNITAEPACFQLPYLPKILIEESFDFFFQAEDGIRDHA